MPILGGGRSRDGLAYDSLATAVAIERPHVHDRSDYGGPFENRIRFPLEFIYQAKPFDAFLRIPHEGTVESTGLGLYYSQKLACLIGARITFTSEFGKGGAFTLTL